MFRNKIFSDDKPLIHMSAFDLERATGTLENILSMYKSESDLEPIEVIKGLAEQNTWIVLARIGTEYNEEGSNFVKNYSKETLN